MRPFEEWLIQPVGLTPVKDYSALLDLGVTIRDERFFADCRCCEREFELCWDVEADGFDPDMAYCGRSPGCLP